MDFVKYGGTSHAFFPAMIGFSEAAQKALVEEVHKRGMVAETHSTSPEGLRVSIEAGVDLVQHPEATDAMIPPDVMKQMIDRGVICAMLENTITGKAWTDFSRRLKSKADSATRADSVKRADGAKAAAGDTLKSFMDSTIAALLRDRPVRAKTAIELAADSSNARMVYRRKNAEALIKAGCVTTIATDNYRASAPEFTRQPRAENQQPGTGSVIALEGLVELGMTPMQALVAATKNGAIAMRRSADLGTVEKGKLADLLLLGGDPLADIHNVRKLALVMKDGVVVEQASAEQILHHPRIQRRLLRRQPTLRTHLNLLRQIPDDFRIRLDPAKDEGLNHSPQGVRPVPIVISLDRNLKSRSELSLSAQIAGIQEIENRPQIQQTVFHRRSRQGKAMVRFQLQNRSGLG